MNVFILSTTQVGEDIYSLIKRDIPIKGFIGLKYSEKVASGISGYKNSKEVCEKDQVPFFEVLTYGMVHGDDIELLKSLPMDILIVMGWQRLVPEWLISHCRLGCIGSHGSPLGIEKGRGRSPQNWALMLGFENFDLSIFKITPGVDDGEIILTTQLKYNLRDDIRTSYIKVGIMNAEMLIRAYRENLFLRQGKQQSEAYARYLPQRLKEDGQIDWDQKPEAIVDFIRALTKPYPGAFTFDEQKTEILLWNAVAFEDTTYGSGHKPGSVLDIFANNELVVKSRNGVVIITSFDYAGNVSALPGQVLESMPFKENINRIINRHKIKYPQYEISEILSEKA